MHRLAAFVALSVLSFPACNDTPESSGPHGATLADFQAALHLDAETWEVLDGDWQEDFGDAAAFGPAYYVRAAAASDDPALQAIADASRDYNLSVVTQAGADSIWMLANLEEVFMTTQGLIEYAGVTGDETLIPPLQTLLDVMSGLVSTFGNYLDVSVGEFAADLYGPTSITAGYAVILLQYAALLDAPDEELRVTQAIIALDVIGEKAFDTDHYQFRPGDEKLYLYPNATMLIALNRAHQLTGEQRFLDRALLVYEGIQVLRDANLDFYHSPYSQGYQGAETDEYGTLSAQNYLLLGLMLMYENTQDPVFLEDILALLRFIQERLYDAEKQKILHHWIDGRPALPTDPDYFCSGCNLQVLYLLWYLEQDLGVPLS